MASGNSIVAQRRRRLLMSASLAVGGLFSYTRGTYAQSVCQLTVGSNVSCAGTSTTPQIIVKQDAAVTVTGPLTVDASAATGATLSDAVVLSGGGHLSFMDAVGATLIGKTDPAKRFAGLALVSPSSGSFSIDTVGSFSGGYGIGAYIINGQGDSSITFGGDITGVGSASIGIGARQFLGSTNLSITTLAGSTIEADQNGIGVNRLLSGNIDIDVNGSIRTANGVDIFVSASRGGDINVTTGDTASLTGQTGIFVDAFLGAGDINLDLGGTIASTGAYGVGVSQAFGRRNIAITQRAGSTITAQSGISASNSGAGDTVITLGGVVGPGARRASAVRAIGELSSSGDIKVQQLAGSRLYGGLTAISAINNGEGATSVDVAGAALSLYQQAVWAVAGYRSGDVDLITRAGSVVRGGKYGALVQNYGHGDSTITVDGYMRADGSFPSNAAGFDYSLSIHGLSAKSAATAGDLTITTGAQSKIRGQLSGVYAMNKGLGATDITIGGDVGSKLAAGVSATNGDKATDLTVKTLAGSTVRGAIGISAVNAGTGATTVTVGGNVYGGSTSGMIVSDAKAAGSTIEIERTGQVRIDTPGTVGIDIRGRSSVVVAGSVHGGDDGGLSIRFDQENAADDRLEIREGFSLVGAVDGGGGRDTLAIGAGAWSFETLNVNGEDFDDDNNPVTPTLPTFLNFEEIVGTSTATGVINVRSGVVEFNGALSGADVSVELGARMGGTGTLRDLTVQSFGAIDPGAAQAIGTLTALGTARFEEQSRLLVDVAAGGASDLLKAQRVEIEGGNVVGFLASPLREIVDGQRSVIVSGQNGVTGRFEEVFSPLAFFDFALDYTPTEVGLTTTVKALETAAATGNQRAAARGLQGFATSADPEALAFYEGLLGAQEFEQVRPIFDAVSGEALASLQSGLVQSSLTFGRSVRDRAAANAEAAATPALSAAAPLAYRGGDPIVTTAFEGVSKAPAPTSLAWGALLGERWTSDRGGARTEQTIGGVIGGLDVFHAEGAFGAVSGGVSFGYSHGSLDIGSRNSTAKTDSAHAGLYGALDSGPLLVTAAASYGFHDAETKRRIGFVGATARADYDAHSFGFSGEARYRFAFGAATFAPLVTLDAAHVITRAGRERGAGPLDLSAKRDDYTAGAAGAGAALGYAWAAGSFGTVRADARAVYEFGFGGDARRRVSFADGPGFTVTGASADHDRLAVGLGLSVEHSNGLTIGARYDGGYAKDAKSHRGQIAASYRF